MSKQIANQGTSKPAPGDMQRAANRPAAKPNKPVGYDVSAPTTHSGRADDPSRKMEFRDAKPQPKSEPVRSKNTVDTSK